MALEKKGRGRPKVFTTEEKMDQYCDKATQIVESIRESLKKENLWKDSYEGLILILQDKYTMYLCARAEVYKNGITIEGLHQEKISPSVTLLNTLSTQILMIQDKMNGTVNSVRKKANSDMTENVDSPLTAFLKAKNND